MYWQINAKYYSIIVSKNTSNKRKIIVGADTHEERDITRYDAWTVARVVGWACSSIALRQAHVSTRTAYCSSGRSRILARYISSSIYSCIHDNFLFFLNLLTDVVHFYIIISIYFLTFNTDNNEIKMWFQFVNSTD